MADAPRYFTGNMESNAHLNAPVKVFFALLPQHIWTWLFPIRTNGCHFRLSSQSSQKTLKDIVLYVSVYRVLWVSTTPNAL